MKSKTYPFLRLLLVFIVSYTVIGCALVQPVPYATGGVKIEKPLSERNFDKPLTLRMNEELLKTVITIKPFNIPGAMSYSFYVGESIKSNILNTLNPIFHSVRVSSLPLKELTSYGVVLDVALKSYEFDISPSIMREHAVRLSIEYKGYKDGKNIFTVLTETSGTSKEILWANIRKTSDDWTRFPIVPASTIPYVHDMGNAYDVALSKSIDKLLGKLSEAWGS